MPMTSFTLLATLVCVSLDQIAIVSSIVQILFWISVATLATLTYLNAKKGILQPVRTEIFKLQLSEIQSVLSLFTAKQEHDLRSMIDLDSLVDRNIETLIHDYCLVKLKSIHTPHTNMSIGDGWRPLSPEVQIALQNNCWIGDSKSSEDRENFWRNYTIPGLILPNSYKAATNMIRSHIAGAFVPANVRTAIERFVEKTRSCETLLVQTLNECAKDLPNRLNKPHLHDLCEVTIWIKNTFNRQFIQEPSLYSLSTAIVDTIRTHLQIDYIDKINTH